MWDTKGWHPGAVTFKYIKDLKRGERKSILWYQINPIFCALCQSRWEVIISLYSLIIFNVFTFWNVKQPVFQLNALFCRYILPFELLQNIQIDRENEQKIVQLVCLPNFNPFFLISVLIINTDKMCGYITLFILILSFKTGSLCWTFMTFEEGMSSHQISKWLWRSVSGLVASRLSKHLLIWISAHLLDNEFCV